MDQTIQKQLPEWTLEDAYGTVQDKRFQDELQKIYCEIKKLRDLYRHLRQLLKEEGMIEATYIYSLYTKGELRSFPIGGTNITGRELIKEELKLIPNYRDQDQNAILILRK